MHQFIQNTLAKINKYNSNCIKIVGLTFLLFSCIKYTSYKFKITLKKFAILNNKQRIRIASFSESVRCTTLSWLAYRLSYRQYLMIVKMTLYSLFYWEIHVCHYQLTPHLSYLLPEHWVLHVYLDQLMLFHFWKVHNNTVKWIVLKQH